MVYLQVAGGLAALYPAGSVPMSDAADAAPGAGEPEQGIKDAAAAGELRDASVAFEGGKTAQAASQQPTKTEADGVDEDKTSVPAKRPASAKVIQ